MLEWSYACLNVNKSRSGRKGATEAPSVADYPQGARMGPRVIDDFEFLWMLRGQALFVTEEEELQLSPGHLLLVPPAVRHSFVWDQQRPCRHGFVHFYPEHVAGLEAVSGRLHRMTGDDPLAGLCAYLIWLGREQADGWEHHVEQTLRVLLQLFTSGFLPGNDAGTTRSAPLSVVLDYLRREWSRMPLRRVDVDELASTAYVSRSYLNRLFQGTFGISVAAALERLRCSRAEMLLTRTDMPISSIARECGFADLYHFSHRFTLLYGVPPSVYRGAGGPASSALDHAGVRRLANALWS